MGILKLVVGCFDVYLGFTQQLTTWRPPPFSRLMALRGYFLLHFGDLSGGRMAKANWDDLMSPERPAREAETVAVLDA